MYQPLSSALHVILQVLRQRKLLTRVYLSLSLCLPLSPSTKIQNRDELSTNSNQEQCKWKERTNVGSWFKHRDVPRLCVYWKVKKNNSYKKQDQEKRVG